MPFTRLEDVEFLEQVREREEETRTLMGRLLQAMEAGEGGVAEGRQDLGEEDGEDEDNEEIRDEGERGHVCHCAECDSNQSFLLFPSDPYTQQYGDAFEEMTEGRQMLDGEFRHATGPRELHPDRGPADLFRREREIPQGENYCECEQNFFVIMEGDDEDYNEDRAMYRRTAALGTDGPYNTVDSRYLVAMRQARHMAGLGTQDLDREIARRALEDPGSYGWVGGAFRAMGFTDEVERDAESYQLR